MNAAVRASGAVPAWIGVVDGTVTVGLTDEQLARFAEPGVATKVARRDLPVAVASGALGATTVCATVWAAARRGSRSRATGGIGGVHPGARPRRERRPVGARAHAGAAGLLGTEVDHRSRRDGGEARGARRRARRIRRGPAAVLPRARGVRRAGAPGRHARRGRGDRSGGVRPAACRRPMLLCNPIPEADAMDAGEVAAAVAEAEARAERDGRARQGTHAVPADRARRDHRWPQPPGEPRAARGQRAGGRTRRGQPGRRASAARSG